MSNAAADTQRRTLLQAAAGLATAAHLGVQAATTSITAAKPAATGKPGDFDFLAGEWKIKNRQLKNGSWEVFDGEATVRGILAGITSVEELRIPARNFSGMGLRLLDLEKKLWADYWVNGKSGVLAPPPSWGSFVNGVGTWDSNEEDENSKKPTTVRGVWDRITPSSCRWYQTVSRDGGASWQENWLMDWTRV
ncbi:MAG: hypothetical protein V4858_02670 [Pseudomonadota bacterium]